jgi:hypothetical protein
MDNYNVIGKTSNELAEKDWQDLTNAFNEVFKKQFDILYFKEKYLKTYLKFSIHGFLLFDNQIVGMLSIIPRLYRFNSNAKIFGLGCDAFILPNHRKDDFSLKEMADAAYKICKKYNVLYLISIPNPTAYPYWKYYGDWSDIATLDYFILPYKMSKLLKINSLFDFISSFLIKITLYLLNLISFQRLNVHEKRISLVRDENFIVERYNNANNYKIYQLDEKHYFVIRKYDEGGVKAIYLIDCYPLTKFMLIKALYRITKDFKGKFDLVLFVGKIDNAPFPLIKIQKSKEPRTQFFTGNCLSEEQKDDFLSISSWNISLADFDNR